MCILSFLLLQKHSSFNFHAIMMYIPTPRVLSGRSREVFCRNIWIFNRIFFPSSSLIWELFLCSTVWADVKNLPHSKYSETNNVIRFDRRCVFHLIGFKECWKSIATKRFFSTDPCPLWPILCYCLLTFCFHLLLQW